MRQAGPGDCHRGECKRPATPSQLLLYGNRICFHRPHPFQTLSYYHELKQGKEGGPLLTHTHTHARTHARTHTHTHTHTNRDASEKHLKGQRSKVKGTKWPEFISECLVKADQ